MAAYLRLRRCWILDCASRDHTRVSVHHRPRQAPNGATSCHITRQHRRPVVPQCALPHLRSLRRLKSLCIAVASRLSDEVDTGSDSEADYLPLLEGGRLPSPLRRGPSGFQVHAGSTPSAAAAGRESHMRAGPHPITHFLASALSLEVIEWKHPSLSDAHLRSLMPSLPELRELILSDSTLMSPTFASSSTLSRNLEDLTINDVHGVTHSLPASELTHLRSLSARRSLMLSVPAISARTISSSSRSHCQRQHSYPP